MPKRDPDFQISIFYTHFVERYRMFAGLVGSAGFSELRATGIMEVGQEIIYLLDADDGARYAAWVYGARLVTRKINKIYGPIAGYYYISAGEPKVPSYDKREKTVFTPEAFGEKGENSFMADAPDAGVPSLLKPHIYLEEPKPFKHKYAINRGVWNKAYDFLLREAIESWTAVPLLRYSMPGRVDFCELSFKNDGDLAMFRGAEACGAFAQSNEAKTVHY